MPPVCDAAEPPGAVAWVVDHGWHTEIAMLAADISGPLTIYRDIFPGAQTIAFGFGKRTFMTAKVETLGELLIGPIPGPGAIQATGLRTTPGIAYPGRSIEVPLPPGGAEALSAFLWRSIAPSVSGGPRLIAEGHFPGSAFYAAQRGYSLGYTCNTWVIDALQQSGAAVEPDVIFASGALNRTASIKGACTARP